MTLQQMIETRANTWSLYQEVLDRADTETGWSAEDRAAMDRMDAELRTLTEDIERRESAARWQAGLDSIDGPAPDGPRREGGDAPRRATDEAYEDAYWAVMRRGVDRVTPEQRALAESGFVSGDEIRAQGVSTDAAGGFLVPEGFWRRLSEAMLFFSPMASVANVITTDSGNDLPWPTNDDTANEGAYVAENVQHTEQDATLAQRKLLAHVCSSKIVRVSFQLLQDSAFDLNTWLPRKLGERVGRRSNRAFTVGVGGTTEPEGVVTNATVGVTAASATALTYDEIIDLEHSVDVAYRNERSRFMFHDLTLATLRKLKDNENRPLWQVSVQAGVPSTFNGRPYTVNNFMADTLAIDAVPILFGDFNAGYVVRRVRGFQTLRLTERYADFLQVGFLGFDRHDGKPDDPGAIRALQMAAA